MTHLQDRDVWIFRQAAIQQGGQRDTAKEALDAQATAVTLWVAHTWVIDAFDYTPYLHVSSPVKECGKSRVFDCLKLLCAKTWAVISITEAVMFRKIEKDAPTLLLDEIDAVFTGRAAPLP